MDHTVAPIAGALTGVCTLRSRKHEMRVMLKKRAGSIVNLSSMGWKVGGWQKRSPGFPYLEGTRSRAVLTGRRARDIGRP